MSLAMTERFTLQVQFGVGRLVDSDDVTPFSLADVSTGRACVNVTSLPFYETLYSLVRVVDPHSAAVYPSDGFVVVPKGDPLNTIEVLTGKGCGENDMIQEETLPAASGTSSQTFSLTRSVSLHVGDVLFVEFRPFLADVQFRGARVIETTLHGYQVILDSHSSPPPSFDLPEAVAESATVRLYYACLKDTLLWRHGDALVTSWELGGPAAGLAVSLHVKVLDETCVQRQLNAQGEGSSLCVVSEKRLAPSRREVSFDEATTTTLVPGHSYTTSVALCFDDACLPAASSAEFTVNADRTLVRVDDAQILSEEEEEEETPGRLEVEMAVSVEPVHPHRPCVFLWAVARGSDGSRLLSDWQLRQETVCSNTQVGG